MTPVSRPSSIEPIVKNKYGLTVERIGKLDWHWTLHIASDDLYGFPTAYSGATLTRKSAIRVGKRAYRKESAEHRIEEIPL